MKRRIQSLFLCSVMLLGSVACKKQEASYETAKPIETTTTSVAETEPTTVETTPSRMPPMTEPFAAVEGFDVEGTVTAMYNGKDDTIVIQCLDNDNNVSTCYVFDPIEKRMIRTIVLEQTYYSVLGMFSNGTIAVVDDTTSKNLYMYSENSDTPKEIVLDIDDYPIYQLDRHNDCIYWTESLTGNILKITESGTISTHISGEDFHSVDGISGSDLVFKASKASEETKSGTAAGFYSLIDGQPIALLAENNDSSTFFTTGCSTTTYYQYTEDYCGGDIILQVFDRNTNQDCQAYKIEFNEFELYRFEGNSKSDYGVMLYNNYENCEEYGEINEVFFVDTQNGTIADSGIEIEKGSVYLNCMYSESIGRWLIAINSYDGTPSSSLLMVDPTLLKFDTQLESAELRLPEKLETVEFEDDFKTIREEADKIEEEFGIRVLIGDEVKHAEANSQYVFMSTEDVQNFYLDREMNRMRELRKVLSMYSKDFFSHFKSKDGKCGLRIAIVEELQTDSYESFSAAGIAYTTGGWYDIAICGSHILGTSLHHEIWHTVENLVGNRHGAIDNQEWMELNPEGFVYSTDFDAYATDCSDELVELTLDYVYYESEPDYEYPYFIWGYSKVTDMEDRATIVERLLSTEYDENGEEQLIDLEKIKMYPHINAKIEFLENWTEQEFGYVYWEKVHEMAEGVHS